MYVRYSKVLFLSLRKYDLYLEKECIWVYITLSIGSSYTRQSKVFAIKMYGLVRRI